MSTTHELYGLSVRAQNCCYNANISKRAELMMAVTNGRFRPDASARGYRGCGWTTYNEMRFWLGLPKEISPSEKRGAKQRARDAVKQSLDALSKAVAPLAAMEIAQWSQGGFKWFDGKQEHDIPEELGRSLIATIKATRAALNSIQDGTTTEQK